MNDTTGAACAACAEPFTEGENIAEGTVEEQKVLFHELCFLRLFRDQMTPELEGLQRLVAALLDMLGADVVLTKHAIAEAWAKGPPLVVPESDGLALKLSLPGGSRLILTR